MNREIKFRGKRVHDGEWAYGFYWHNIQDDRHLIIKSEKVEMMVSGQWQVNNNVLPESVGQLTGLKDKNGVEIYEGDVIIGTAILTDSYGYDSKFNINGVVQYNEEHSSWTFTDNVKHPVENYFSFLWQIDADTIQIIGNIHGNPELLP
jgi:uncharacterized phage protein (TIGR01671 family)